jgi:hypothetical protein
MTIRIHKRIDAETAEHLPELRPLIGKDVELIVRERSEADALQTASDEFWNPPTLDELSRRQGVAAPVSAEDLYGSFSADDFDGFEEFLDEQRKRWRSRDGEAE